ncbi:MAG: hypothetical protein FWE67_06765 [Planctomycetaceae bacterium]|nr:hypothetical protein [Planctomycetaceae bacterium]
MSTQSLPNVPEQNSETELTEEERERKLTAYYEREIQKALESNQWIPLTPEYWNEFLRKREEIKAARKAGKQS